MERRLDLAAVGGEVVTGREVRAATVGIWDAKVPGGASAGRLVTPAR